jgi:hypothetical protein
MFSTRVPALLQSKLGAACTGTVAYMMPDARLARSSFEIFVMAVLLFGLSTLGLGDDDEILAGPA